MSKNTKVKLTRTDQETGEKRVWAVLELAPNLQLESERTTKEGYSATFKYFGVQNFVLRERSRGTMECEWRPYNRVSRELGDPIRKRTGETRIDRALNEAIRQFIHPEHEKRVVAGPQLEQEESEGPAAIGNLSAEDLLILVPMLDLLHENKTTRQHELKVLALMAAVFGSKPFAHFGKADIELLYEIRKKGFDLASALLSPTQSEPQPEAADRAEGVGDPGNAVWAVDAGGEPRNGQAVPLAQPDRRPRPREPRPSAAPVRAPAPIRLGLPVRGRQCGVRQGARNRQLLFEVEESGERKLHESRRSMEDVVPGITRAMLVFQYGHGMRPGSWRHIRVDEEVALNTVRCGGRSGRSASPSTTSGFPTSGPATGPTAESSTGRSSSRGRRTADTSGSSRCRRK